MEASDAFATEINEGEDPFAGTDFGTFAEDVKPAESPAAEPDVPIDTAGLPVVDKEGNVIADPTPAVPDGTTGSTTDGARAAEGAAYAAENAPPQAEPTTKPQVGPTPEAQAALDALKAPGTAGAGAATPVIEQAAVEAEDRADPPTAAAPAAATTPATSVPTSSAPTAVESEPPMAAPAESAGPTEPAAEPASAPAEQPADPAPVPADPPEAQNAAPEPALVAPDAPPAATSEPKSGDSTQPPAAPEEEYVPPVRTDAQGRATHRPYVVLRQLTPGQFEQVTWHVDADGAMAPKGPGTKVQRYATERSAPDALVTGYKAVGAPANGALLVAVPISQFQVKTVKPKAPEPSRTRLSIG